MKSRGGTTDDGWYRLGEIVIATVGIREGLIAIAMQLIGRGHPGWMSLPLYLPTPWSYVAAAGVIVVAFIALAALDRARLAAFARAGQPAAGHDGTTDG